MSNRKLNLVSDDCKVDSLKYIGEGPKSVVVNEFKECDETKITYILIKAPNERLIYYNSIEVTYEVLSSANLSEIIISPLPELDKR